MRAIIHYAGDYDDSLMISADTIEELREVALYETEKRGWDPNKCWSEVMED